MACIIDIGEANEIQPKNKQKVGQWLALVADKLVYSRDGLALDLVYQSFITIGNRICICLENIGKGLAAKNGRKITGFVIAGADKQFFCANASIEGNDIIIYSENVHEPVAVRYVWDDKP